ncbi:MAG: pyridoxal-dependent decarboxylase [Candidatus Promineifilaceae bacterium]|nr:pyridoxal-dependent decarboxylase [Candidatus Promineifilaceae bacterium]
MDNAVPNRQELGQVIKLVSREAAAYLEGLDQRPARAPAVRKALEAFNEPLPEQGEGALRALSLLINKGTEAAVATAGPRSFHFVIGGSTPAALGADWWVSTLDQMVYAWVASPLATRLEQISLKWLQALFGLPPSWQGVMTTGATMANFVCLAAARQWYGERLGIDIAEDGLTAVPRPHLYASALIHPSDVKALSMLGMGRAALSRLGAGENGAFDLAALERSLQTRQGEPAIIIAVAGEPNAGRFDPLGKLADLAAEYGAWLHVDGAFGLFAALSPRHADLVQGVERAHSVAVDGHKWLNVPYDCGFAFVGDDSLMAKSFAHAAEYLPDPSDPEPVLGGLAPEMSRRARSLTVWATLKAYGRRGIQRMVEKNIALAQHLAHAVEELPDLELLADVPLNVVCFRYNPGGLTEAQLNRLNRRLGRALLADGRVFVGTTTFRDRVGLRPAIVNWRTRREDIDLLVGVVRQLGAKISPA